MSWWWRGQSYGRGGPGLTCDENMRWNPYEFPLIAGRFARGCSPSDIYSGLVSPHDALVVERTKLWPGEPRPTLPRWRRFYAAQAYWVVSIAAVWRCPSCRSEAISDRKSIRLNSSHL